MRTWGQFNETFTSVIIGVSESRGEFPIFDRLVRESVVHLFGRLASVAEYVLNSSHGLSSNSFKGRTLQRQLLCSSLVYSLEFSVVISNRGRYGVEITFTKRSCLLFI